ncbi:Pachytene checkpoint protein 2, partial [Massospora cicadina]
ACLLKPSSVLSLNEAVELVAGWFEVNLTGLDAPYDREDLVPVDGTELGQHFIHIRTIFPETGLGALDLLRDCCVSIHPYRLLPNLGYVDLPVAERDEAQPPGLRCCNLPNPAFEGLWRSLVFDGDLKHRLLSYVRAAAEFGELGIDSHLVALNRLVLLHGPPGTGKTSLARALAHTLSIVLGLKFNQFQLLELNCHGLYSRWFSESSKAVVRAFEQVHRLARQPSTSLVLLVDEVESVAMDRGPRWAGTSRPTASEYYLLGWLIRQVVNALLTQLDKLRAFPNVLVVATTNLTRAIDAAVVDRADISLFVGPPSPAAVARILRGALAELLLKRAVELSAPIGPSDLESIFRLLDSEYKPHLDRVGYASQGMSARRLRKLPLLAYASCVGQFGKVPLPLFLSELERAAKGHTAGEPEG